MLIRQRLKKLWRALTEPVPSVQDPEDRHRARFVAVLLITLLPTGLAVAGVPELLYGNPLWRDNDFRVLVAGTVLWSIAYALSRTGRHRLAAGLAVGIALVAIFVIVITDQNPEDVVYLLMPLLLSSAVLPLRVTLYAVAAVVVEILLLPIFLAAVSPLDVILGSLSFVFAGVVLVLLTVRLRDDLARERRAKLTESEERYRAVVEKSHNGILIVGEDYEFDYVNDTLCEILGRGREEIIGHDFREFLDEDAKKLVADRYIRRQRGEDVPPRYEFNIVRKDGEKGLVEISSTTMRDSQGRTRTVAQILDITERKRAQEALRESEERLRLIVDGTEALLINVSPRGRITYVNEAAARKFQHRSEDMIGRLYLHFVHPEDRARVSRAYQEQAEAGTYSTSLEFRVVTARGDVRWVSFVAHPIAQEGQVTEIAGLAMDVTERNEMEQQLRQQERLAAVGQLAAGVAHDFRNLLATIILYAQMDLKKPGLPAGVADDLQVIIEESNKAADLVQQMLDFSSRAMIERQPLDLAPLIADVVNSVLRRTIPEHIQIKRPAGTAETTAPFTVKADPGRIQQVLINLALNARDALPEGGELRLALSRVEVLPDDTPPVTDMPPGEFVCLTVADTGTGMTEEVEEHLFEPFFTTKDVDKGTGLGLAQVYGIVRQHEGFIDVETELEEGTVFRIYLPAHQQRVEEGVPEEATALPPGHGETILFVEDHEALRKAGESILASLGYRVVTATTGREALAMYQSGQRSGARRIDLLVTDLIMPEMGGGELLRELRTMNPEIQALAVTGHALQKGDWKKLTEAGFADVVRKPFDANDLATAIRRTLGAS